MNWNSLWRFLHEFLAGVLTTPANGNTFTKTLGSGYDKEADDNLKRSRIVTFLRAQIHDKYVFGTEVKPGDESNVWDCSELLEAAYNRNGLLYPDGCIYQIKVLDHRKVKAPKPGDVFFYGPNANGIRHTGAYVGNDMVIHAAGRPINQVVEVPRFNIEANPRFLGWFRHPDLSLPPEDRA